MSWYSSLQPQTQRYTAWAFLGFLIIFTSGFWTLKLALAGFLLLLRPVVVHPSDARKGKSKKRQKDADGQPFSADAMVAALQRIPETFTYGNATPSKSSPMQATSKDTVPPTAAVSESQPPSLPPSSPPSLPPSLHSSTTDPYNIGPLPNPHNPTPMSSVEWGDSSSDSISSTAPWQRKPSGSFHRIEVAKKFVNRKFGGSGTKSREETPTGASTDEEERQFELLRDCTPTLEDGPSTR